MVAQRQYLTLEDQLGSSRSIAAEGIIALSDYHGHSAVLGNSLNYASKNNLALVINGDAVNDYGFPELAEELGYESPERIQLQYLVGKTREEGSGFGEDDLQTYLLLRKLAQTGGDMQPFLDQIPEQRREEARQTLEQVLQYGQSELFQKKIQNINEDFIRDEGERIQENVIGMQALYQVFIDEEARRFARELNKYSDTKVLFNKGNHEPTYFVDAIRQYLDDPTQIVDVTNTRGYISVANSAGEELTVAGMTNCAQLMPYLQDIFAPQEIAFLYEHMKIGQTKEEELVLNDSQVKNLTKDSVVIADRDYQRIRAGENRDLDVFLTHGQVGTPRLSGGGEGINVPYYKSAAALSLEAKLTVEGHIHGEYEGKNSLGSDMVRPVGQRAVVIKKKNGEVVVDNWVEVNPNFDGNHNNPIPYDRSYLAGRVEELLELYIQQIEQLETEQKKVA